MVLRALIISFSLSMETEWKLKEKIFFDFIVSLIFVILWWYWYLNDAFFTGSSMFRVFHIWHSFCIILSFDAISSNHSLKALAISSSEITGIYFFQLNQFYDWFLLFCQKGDLAVVQNFFLSVISDILKVFYLSFFNHTNANVALFVVSLFRL